MLHGEMNMQENRMREGTGEESYARNSLIQAVSVAKVTTPMIRETLEELYGTMLPKCVTVAELGCASGPNTLMMIPQLIDVTYEMYRRRSSMNHGNPESGVVMIPEIKIILNDLYGNDFNTISISLPEFHKQLQEERQGDVGPYFISAIPGSFHKKIFPSNFLHFVHTSNSAHWLSQVPTAHYSSLQFLTTYNHLKKISLHFWRRVVKRLFPEVELLLTSLQTRMVPKITS